jgi:hypothetical protein
MTPYMEGPCGRPILRRPSVGTSTDSEVGVFCEDDVPRGLVRKRSNIKFAVRCTATSDSCASPSNSVPSRQTSLRRGASVALTALPSCMDEDEDEEEVEDDDEGVEAGPSSLRCAIQANPYPEYDDSESDDEGYVEDEEEGFSSDGEPLHTYLSSNKTSWAHRSVSENPYANRPIASPRRGRSAELSFQLSTDDADAVPPPTPMHPRRGRKISIAVSKVLGKDRCSRHLSPPPPELGVDTSFEPAPPAARSPSAAELCRRRAKCWKSDDAPLSGNVGLGLRALSATRPGMMPEAGKGILRTPSNPIGSRRMGSACRGTPGIGRRESAPAASCMQIRAQGRCSASIGAREGLEAMLRRKSTK